MSTNDKTARMDASTVRRDTSNAERRDSLAGNRESIRNGPILDTPRGDIRCPFCARADGQYVTHFEEGSEYMERFAWCKHCAIWRVLDYAIKSSCFPFVPNVESPEVREELDEAFEALKFEAMLTGYDVDDLRDYNAKRGWSLNPFRPGEPDGPR